MFKLFSWWWKAFRVKYVLPRVTLKYFGIGYGRNSNSNLVLATHYGAAIEEDLFDHSAKLHHDVLGGHHRNCELSKVSFCYTPCGDTEAIYRLLRIGK